MTRCPKCRYVLSGLPAEHRCPECGFDYDASMFGFGAWPNQGRPRPWQAIAYGAGVLICAWITIDVGLRTSLIVILIGGWMLLGLLKWAFNMMRRRAGETESVIVFDDEGVTVWGVGGWTDKYEWSHLRPPLLRSDGQTLVLRRSGWWPRLAESPFKVVVECPPEMRDAFRRELARRWKVSRSS
ncbi:MAG: hypothetical protein ACYTGG_09175 [Planctomycetota bacterium]